MPWAGAHDGVWDVKLMLLLPAKACYFQGDWILASQRQETQDSRSAEGRSEPESRMYAGSREKGNAGQQAWRNGSAFSCYGPLKLAQEWSTETSKTSFYLSCHHYLVLFDLLIESLRKPLEISIYDAGLLHFLHFLQTHIHCKASPR